MKTDYYAKLVIYGIPKMDEGLRSDIVRWLREKAVEIATLDAEKYDDIFTARLMK